MSDLMDHMTLPDGISVIVPVYNSEKTLSELVERLEPVLNDCHTPFELILVNDGSRDGSWAAIHSLSQSYPWVRGA